MSETNPESSGNSRGFASVGHDEVAVSPTRAPRARIVSGKSSSDRGSRLAAAPAVIVLAASLTLSLAMRNGDVRERYDRAAVAAMAAEDYGTAQVCYERLLQQSPDDPTYRGGLNLALNGLSRSSDAGERARSARPARDDR